MAKVSLKETVSDSEIVRLGEIRNKPDYPFPDGEYGITGKYADYSLVKKRIAYRTGTAEDGEYDGEVIEYEIWEDYPCYVSTLTGLFESYAKILNLTEFKTKKMKGEISELVAIHQKTHDMINAALKGYDEYLTKEQKEKCHKLDIIGSLEAYIDELKSNINTYRKYEADIERMYNEIKEKRKIIVEVDKPKKHKSKEEE
jgi:hypothetical protein